ncbi:MULTISPECIES: 30S ribosomal protein S7 [Thermomicrobium]|jgi:small subunit ribosomal protein S7|uniref:Small ribosomal subunit protein uS7 n=1 Tax=Thermomicrobium roseum (strain ATCC 27502 / DSM 5159 / P-2) TaxID=309801 RepID=RS7_THERP|nr:MULTISPECIES: 30S ribosomal protein S7 [Thermomicrobium]B9KZZ1.1 RecName: Full=Small ribosomal subunit protein uS7; AltName: Full=30S ribosomal protein S7 [Thermomicrobium roseum DSM 5159]ACM05807.1 ribosomal protein S7 [Thermomicrobium roseum DSM 5159]MBO9306378.1 30S ribosomal protein S7 [Thermomicrobium sp.]MBO9358965.1 30S ribosomal protein S7 [Thermomicrobium sp.]MBO9385928.1 30S ribosomal protein S7 [Thermomicrobium sp.]MBO9405738.1 30S ribosomal protein S7 [Thermomicrobium sp.]
MPRRPKYERRTIPPDPKYGSELLQRFINKVMKRGKKSLAERIVYSALDIVAQRTGQHPLEVFQRAIHNASPLLEVKPRRVGGATYQVPVQVEPHRRVSLAMRWLIQSARNRSGYKFVDKLAAEIIDAANNTGATIKKRDDTHRMAEANRAFAHYRW